MSLITEINTDDISLNVRTSSPCMIAAMSLRARVGVLQARVGATRAHVDALQARMDVLRTRVGVLRARVGKPTDSYARWTRKHCAPVSTAHP